MKDSIEYLVTDLRPGEWVQFCPTDMDVPVNHFVSHIRGLGNISRERRESYDTIMENRRLAIERAEGPTNTNAS